MFHIHFFLHNCILLVNLYDIILVVHNVDCELFVMYLIIIILVGLLFDYFLRFIMF
jgi:hypothetical protein